MRGRATDAIDGDESGGGGAGESYGASEFGGSCESSDSCESHVNRYSTYSRSHLVSRQPDVSWIHALVNSLLFVDNSPFPAVSPSARTQNKVFG